MEFNEKLQELRRSKGITQEELAEAMYVSRTAVSKWESGRGYPNITSLKALAKFFSVTVDDLLDTEGGPVNVLDEGKRKNGKIRRGVFGLLDICSLILLFLPVYRIGNGGTVRSVSLFTFEGVGKYTDSAYYFVIIGTVVCGILSMIHQYLKGGERWNFSVTVSLCFGCGMLLTFIVSSQPYAATIAFIFIAVKAFLLIKHR